MNWTLFWQILILLVVAIFFIGMMVSTVITDLYKDRIKRDYHEKTGYRSYELPK